LAALDVDGDGAGGRFALGRADIGRLETVVDGVYQQMPQRLTQLLDDLAVHLDVLARDLEPHVLAEFAPEVPDELREGLGRLPEWHVGERYRLVLELLHGLGEALHVGPPRRQDLL